MLCNPNEDPDGCECRTEVDECYEIKPKNLISSDDPAVLNAAANIQSQWDANIDAYIVEIDATGLTAAGVMKLNSNRGQWKNRAEMLDYLGTLIGQDLKDFTCSPQALPPMLVRQNGVTARYDELNQSWAAANSGNLIHDAITDENGVVFFNGQGLNLFPSSSCGGPSSERFDEESGSDAAAHQCSSAVDANSGVDCGTDVLGGNCEPDVCDTLGQEYAETVLQTSDTIAGITGSIRCRGTQINGSLACDGDLSLIIRERANADDLKVESTFFDGSSVITPTPVEESNKTEAVHDKSDADGICSEGTVTESQTFIRLKTRAGTYDSNITRCKDDN